MIFITTLTIFVLLEIREDFVNLAMYIITEIKAFLHYLRRISALVVKSIKYYFIKK